MEKPDEGSRRVSTEGRDLSQAIAAAAAELGLKASQVDYKLDLSHFRSATGGSLPRDTVRIIAWSSGRPETEEGGGQPAAAERPRRARRPREEARPQEARPQEARPREARPREARVREAEPGERKPEGLRGAEAQRTEASDFAEAWFLSLLGHMDVTGTVTGTGSDERVHLNVEADRAGRIIGKRGSTLGAIRHLLSLALEQRFGPRVVDVDIADDRPRGERPAKAGRGKPPARPKRPRRPEQGRYPPEKLQALARRAAAKARESQQTITVNLELNSYDRRLVHLEIAELEGVESRSEERDGLKYVQVIPLGD